eukprot:CAMPEP_0119319458 /NCGR_PEP_ID=MMETSP1333-20130426/49462_1 /TAXON_ID=418940 /ORGANISM="Scyphosphaera apsteinii, Strain RCC1455" /LENGTH=225 /DNA_ID=CAMNT_0007325873 /DNA_START=151 /DNA_END=828 /DNA_ORIENTATION=+
MSSSRIRRLSDTVVDKVNGLISRSHRSSSTSECTSEGSGAEGAGEGEGERTAASTIRIRRLSDAAKERIRSPRTSRSSSSSLGNKGGSDGAVKCEADSETKSLTVALDLPPLPDGLGQKTVTLVLKPEAGESLGMAFEEGTTNKVVAVRADSPAHKAGVLVNDVVLKLNGKAIGRSSAAEGIPAIVSIVQGLDERDKFQLEFTVLRGRHVDRRPTFTPRHSSGLL